MDNEIDVSRTRSLSWFCIDPDRESITYDIYLGATQSPPLFQSGISDTKFLPGNLNVGKTYYWKVVADDGENRIESEVWSFTTLDDADSNEIIWKDIPAGDFTFGKNDEVRTITYDFQIMKYEVTNAQYVKFLNELKEKEMIIIDDIQNIVRGPFEGNDILEAYESSQFYQLAQNSSQVASVIHWNGKEFSIDPHYENHPVINVSWFGAYAFAKHYSYFLPVEEEWEKATRANTGYDYPWGDVITGSNANYKFSGDPFDYGYDPLGTTPVGYYNGQNYNGFQTIDSPSPYGVYDLTGNVSGACPECGRPVSEDGHSPEENAGTP